MWQTESPQRHSSIIFVGLLTVFVQANPLLLVTARYWTQFVVSQTQARVPTQAQMQVLMQAKPLA